MWEPLPLIVYGYAVHPLTPFRRETRTSSRNRLSTVTEASTDDITGMRDLVTLEVGDEVYAFEKYTPGPREPVEGIWYRGYVLRSLPINPCTHSEYTLSTLQIRSLYHSPASCDVVCV